jgi:hypothetical protein
VLARLKSSVDSLFLKKKKKKKKNETHIASYFAPNLFVADGTDFEGADPNHSSLFARFKQSPSLCNQRTQQRKPQSRFARTLFRKTFAPLCVFQKRQYRFRKSSLEEISTTTKSPINLAHLF